MAAKYQLITELYRRTGITVAKNPQAWQSFLAAACRNYKCRFDEQLLIYAQRPDAIAVAELDTWNKRFKRWVNKDSKGIAVFDPKGRRNCYKLGILPKNKKQNYARLHYLLKDDLMKMEAIAKETRLLCRNHIDTAQQLCIGGHRFYRNRSGEIQRRKERTARARNHNTRKSRKGQAA